MAADDVPSRGEVDEAAPAAKKQRSSADLPQRNYHRDMAYEASPDGTNLESLRRVVRACVAHAAGVPDEEMAASPVSGGITNQLFKVALGPGVPPVLVRIFGGEGMIDRNLDTAVFVALADAGIGPGYHGRFANGRVEAFIEGAASLSLDDMGDAEISPQVAAAVAKLHCYQLPAHLEPFFATPGLFGQLWAWLAQAREGVEGGKLDRWGEGVRARYVQSIAGLVGEGLARAEAELKAMEAAVPVGAPAVFCNNDLLMGNIMKNWATGRIQLIDFEYGGRNYRGFDVANHWCEWAGGTTEEDNGRCRYERFPSEAQQRDFCRAYVRASRAEGGGHAGETEEEGVEALLREARWFVPAAHLYWGLWALNQAVLEGVESFDYLTYCEQRMQQFYAVKEGYLRASAL